MEDAEPTAALDDQWANRLRHNGSFAPVPHSFFSNWFKIQDDVEVLKYGLKPFEARGRPASLGEARERGSYTLTNSMRADACSPLYGNLTLVLDAAFVRKGLLLTAIDTGEWTALCNGSKFVSAAHGAPPAAVETWHPYPHNCGAYDWTLGTADHFTHLWLSNVRYWLAPNATDADVGRALVRKFQQLVAPNAAPLTGADFIHYWEGMPAMALPFDRAVNFAVASFPALFGSPAGVELREWCDRYGWPLVWSLGLNTGRAEQFFSIGYNDGTFAANRRVLDARAKGATASLPGAAAAALDAAWAKAAALRAAGYTTANATTWAAQWAAFAAASPAAANLAPVTAGACPAKCFAKDAAGACALL